MEQKRRSGEGGENAEDARTSEEQRWAEVLREMKVCRFCLDDAGPLSSIYERDAKQTVPLPLQVMACVAIEVFQNDGMPQLICKTCRQQTYQAYKFKTTCKRTDDALKLFLVTGNLVKPTPASTKTVETPKRVLLNAQNPPTKSQKTDSGKAPVAKPTVVKKEIESEVQQTISDSRSSEDMLNLVDDDNNPEDTESQIEFAEVDESPTLNPTLQVPLVATDVFPCPHCERSFPLKQLLDLHKVMHERERGFTCNLCDRKFFTKYDLGKHLQTHTDSKPFTCVVCDKTFARESLLHRHEKIHIDVPKYLCAQCDKTFLTKEDLEQHMEKHNKRRPYTCGLCGKGFVFKQGLERHEATHANEKPHKCNYCEASFTSAIKLTRHITSHAGLRPYPCKRCGRTFLLSHHLTRHMRSHLAAKSPSGVPIGQHKCDVCSMSFRRKDSLINHSAIHSMVNLRCVICNTSFENAQKVKEHITTHLSGLPYPCDKCDYSFETQDQLEEHEVKHAEMEYEEQIEKETTEEELMKAKGEMGEDDSDEEDMAEFTITNALETPEVVRRSKRETKIKNYAEFLKEELGSDVEGVEDDDDQSEDVVMPVKSSSTEDDLKPIVRTEGTKVYSRKSSVNRVRPIILNPAAHVKEASPEQINEPQQLSGLDSLSLTNKAIQALGNKQSVDMKIGDKMVRVQKLVLTQAEVEAMAREGRLEKKGNAILLKKTVVEKVPGRQVGLDDKRFGQKPQVKRTYRGVKEVKDDVEDGGGVDAEASSSSILLN